MDKRLIGIGVAVVGAALLVFSSFSSSWFTGESWGAEFKGGLTSLTACDSSECRTISWSDGPGASQIGGFRIAAKVTLFTSLAAAFMLLLSAFLRYRGKFIFRPMAPSSAAILLIFAAVIASMAVMFNNPGRGMMGTGITFLFFMLGAGFGLIGAIVIGRARPNDWLGELGNDASENDFMPEPADPPRAAQPAPAAAWPGVVGPGNTGADASPHQ